MNALTVLSLAALAACGSAQFGINYAYPGFYSGLYPGFYPGAYPSAVTLKTVAPEKVTLKTIAPAPLTYNVAPVAAVAPVAPITPIQSQYHAQDEIGQYSFGYAGGPSSRAESRDAFGIVRGSYNYIDSEGQLQTQHYVADALGFRVSGTNLPVAPEAPEAAALALPGPIPEPVQDTPEVAAAKAAHQQAFDEAAAAAAAAPGSRKKRSVVLSPSVYSPLRFSYGFSAPLQYTHNFAYPSLYNAPLTFPAATPISYTAAAPTPVAYTAAAPAALRDAELLKIVHNPGHATSYRVD